MILKRIFSGIQPTNVPHIGNYLGAIKNWEALQENNYHDSSCEVMFAVVDLHSFTSPHKPEILRENIYDMTASLIACGIDPNKSVLFQQSQVPYHTELAWYLSCLASTGQLNRMHQWKTKSGRDKNEASLGLLSYPTLMAADVLLYKSTHIPVGEDQVQHLELTRDLCQAFNKKYSSIFPLPEILLTKSPRIMNLRNPTKKMSKSDQNHNTRIDITDSNEDIAMKIKKSMTDSIPFLDENLKERNGVRNLIDIYSAFSDISSTDIIKRYCNVEYFTKNLKKDLADIIVEKLSPIRNEYLLLRTDEKYLQDVLNDGSNKAFVIADNVMKEVRKSVGIR